jgi:hypothetical protein
LLLLDEELDVCWTAELDAGARSLAPVAGEGRVWVSGEQPPFPLRLGGGGVLELEPEPLALLGAVRGAAARDGGLFVAAPGAVLRLDARGAALPGQGGFNYLADLDPVPER